MEHDKYDEHTAHAVNAYHEPPAPPLEEMWRSIDSLHFDAHRASKSWRRLIPLIAVAAAALVAGIGLGRYALPREATQQAGSLPAVVASSPATTRLDAPYDVATNRYLDQTAALLIALPGTQRSGRTDARFVAQARDLLVTTRLLLDSPAADDPDVGSLLSDLELVLAQIAQLSARDAGDLEEMDLITAAMEQHEVLPRLRMVVGQMANGD
jgi:hypothetical protein